jgi:predicted small lipoprotein YifL
MSRILSAVLLAALIAGCGMKGPLYHPEDPPPSKKAAKKPAPHVVAPETKEQAP